MFIVKPKFAAATASEKGIIIMNSNSDPKNIPM